MTQTKLMQPEREPTAMSIDRNALYAEAFGLLNKAQRILGSVRIRHEARVAMTDPTLYQHLIRPTEYQDGDIWIVETKDPDYIACGHSVEEARAGYWFGLAQTLWVRQQRETPWQILWRGICEPWAMLAKLWAKARGKK
jgi:hypothetical protein